VLINRNTLREHRPWIIATLVVAVLAILWYLSLLMGRSWDQRPRGSSGPGFLFGIAGGGICLFEFLLWPRKMVRTWRIGRAVVWMRAHIWLGLLSFPLLVLHSGFYLGGPLSTLLMVLFLVVIASGIWGLILQQFLPQRMLDDVPAETIYSQIDHVSGLLAAEAARLVEAVCGPVTEDRGRPLVTVEEAAGPAPHSFLVVGAVRGVGGVKGKVLQTRGYVEPVPDAEALRDFFDASALTYLEQGKLSKSPLAQANRSAAMFMELRERLPSAAHPAVDTLEALCDQRRQFDLQIRLHRWLHNWLWVHLPLSIALIVLMFVHVWVALKYI
jgi:hypothetical protein